MKLFESNNWQLDAYHLNYLCIWGVQPAVWFASNSDKLGVWPTMYLIVPGPLECQQKRIVVLNPSFHNHKKRFTFVACSTCHIRQLPQSPAEWGLRYEENQKVPQESTGSRSLSKFCKHRRSSWAELRVLIGSSQTQLRTYPWQFFSRIQPFAPIFVCHFFWQSTLQNIDIEVAIGLRIHNSMIPKPAR